MLELKLHEINFVYGGNCECYNFAYSNPVASVTFYDNRGQPGSITQKCQYFCCVEKGAYRFRVCSYDTHLCNPAKFQPTDALFRLGFDLIS
jgi:hypothetical protein